MNKSLDYTRYYLKWHSDTPEHIKGVKYFYQRMLSSLLPSEKEIRILDVGCGMGFTIMALNDLGYTFVEGIEVDEGQVRSCVSKGLNVKQVENSAHYLFDYPHSYDLVLALDVIEHVPYEMQLGFMRAINYSLKPKGEFICTVPNANSGLANRWRYNDWTHHISFTEHSLDFLLFNAGFDQIEVHGTEFFHAPPYKSLISRAIFHKWLWKTFIHWWMFRTVRRFRRIEMIAELGWEQGRKIPLSLNLLATAKKLK